MPPPKDDPDDASTKEAKRKFLLTASFEEQEALLAPPPEPVPTPPRQLSSQPRLRALTVRKGPTPVALGVHQYVSAPESHPSWPTFLERALEADIAPWQAQVMFRLVTLAVHGRDSATRLSALGRLCAELDPWLTPTEPLRVGPVRLDAPAASPIASPSLPGVSLLAGLELPGAAPDAIASLFAAAAGWAAWHAPAVEINGPEHALPPPLDMVEALARSFDRAITRVPIPHRATDARTLAQQVASGNLVTELSAAATLADQDPVRALGVLPALIERGPIPGARVVLMNTFARAARALLRLPTPPRDSPGLFAQVAARLASPLESVTATALAELRALNAVPDARAVGLDLPSRFPTALSEARRALAEARPVPRWVIANTQGSDRALLCASLLGRLPSADTRLLDALVGLAPADLEPALHETMRASWTPRPAKDAARACLVSLGRLL